MLLLVGHMHTWFALKNKTEGGVYCKATWQTKDLCVFVRKPCEQQNGFEPRSLERLIQYFRK